MNFIKFAGLTALIAGSVLVGCSSDDTTADPGTAGAAGTGDAGAAGAAGAAAGAGGSAAGAGGSAAGAGGSAAGAGGSAAGAAGGDGTGTGPAAGLLCKSSGKNAFQTYGSAFGAVRDGIIGNVAAELGKGGTPGFGPSFNSVAADPAKLAALEANLGDFLVFVYGGPNNYKGQSMKVAHKDLAITQAQYDYFLTNDVVKALTDKMVPQDDIDSCFAPPLVDKAFVADIVTATAPPTPGPGASLKCDSSGKNAYDTYGSAFGAVRDGIIGNVAAELGKGGTPGFGPSFNSVAADPAKLAALEANLGDFLVFVYGGPNNYKGQSMTDAHKDLAITQAQYDYFLTNDVVKALTDKGVPQKDIDTCFAPPLVDKAFVATIVTK